MTNASTQRGNRTARSALVEQHIRFEDEHDLEGVLSTFGADAQYDDEPWDEHYKGQDGVGIFYEQLMRAIPDLQIDVLRRHVADEAILVEVSIRGTHLGTWRGLPATGAASRSFAGKAFWSCQKPFRLPLTGMPE